MDGKKIIIIGAGISGLSAGIFARLNGFDVTILEMGQHAGGVCTSWRRDGYNVNGSLHWLVGSAPGLETHRLWQQLGVIENSVFYNHDRFVEYRDLEGVDLHFYTEIDRLHQHLLSIAPEDEDVIDEFCSGIRTIAENPMPLGTSVELLSAWDWTKIVFSHIPALMTIGRFTHMTVREYAGKFRSRALRAALENFWSPDMSITFILAQLAFASKGYAGYLRGGSGAFSEKLVKRYQDLGGKLIYGKKASRIMIQDHAAIGVGTMDGGEHLADYIVTACDGKTVLFDMLGGQYLDKTTRHAYETLDTFPSLIYFSAGIRRTFAEVPPSVMGYNIPLTMPLKAGNFVHSRATFQIYNFDPQLAPRGRTLVTAMLHTDYAYWKNLYDQERFQYEAERVSLSRRLIESLEKYFPGTAALLDFSDTATPITYETMTGNFRGSYEGWLPTPEALRVNLPLHFKSLKNFYMAGHWVKPGGGMPPAASSGRDAIHLICKQEKRHFNTEDISTVASF